MVTIKKSTEKTKDDLSKRKSSDKKKFNENWELFYESYLDKCKELELDIISDTEEGFKSIERGMENGIFTYSGSICTKCNNELVRVNCKDFNVDKHHILSVFLCTNCFAIKKIKLIFGSRVSEEKTDEVIDNSEENIDKPEKKGDKMRRNLVYLFLLTIILCAIVYISQKLSK